MLNKLERRVIELSYHNKLTHISSCLNIVNVLDEVYRTRKPDEPVVLGAGHAALALFVVLEKYGHCLAQEMIDKHGTHANRDEENGIYVTCGSLGQAETVSVGLAMANPDRNVWLVTSDGAAMEGAVWEALRVARKLCPNLMSYIIFNGSGAYGRIARDDLPISTYVERAGDNLPEFLQGMKGHYLTLTSEQYESLMA